MPNPTFRYHYLTVLIFLLASMLLSACVPAPSPTPTAVLTLDASAVAVDAATPEATEAAEAPTEEPAEPAEEAAAAETVAEETVAAEEEPSAGESESVAFNSWTVEQLYGMGTLGSVPVTAEFVSDTQLSGWTGCNDYEATFAAGADNSIQVTELSLTSDNPCHSEAATNQELLLQKALSEATAYELSGADLTLSNAAGDPVLTMRNAAVLTLIDTTWAVTAYDDSQGNLAPVDPEGPALTMNLRQNAVNGFSGCNNYTGTYEASGDNISIDNIASDAAGTGSAGCVEASPLIDQEAAYRKALTTAVTWEIDGPHLTLSGEDGRPVVIFLAGLAVGEAAQ